MSISSSLVSGGGRLLGCAVVVLTLASALRAQASFRGLGDGTTMAFDVAPNGLVVGYGRVGLTAAKQAFAWTPAGGSSNLGGNDPWYRSTVATAVTPDGGVVVGQDGDQAFRWTQAGGRTSLGIPTGSTQAAATGVSADGSVVVGSGFTASTNRGQATRWTADGVQTLGFLPGTNSSFATGVSADGKVVTGYSGASDLEAFRWTAAGGMAALGSLAGAPYTYSYGQAISADGGTIVGLSASAHGFEAFRWTAANGMTALGATGMGTSVATAVSADGAIIGGNWLNPDGSENGFLWSEHSGVRALVDVMTRDYGLGRALQGWGNLGIFSVSENGRYVAGRGYFEGQQQAWLFDRGAGAGPIDPPGGFNAVPEPATFALVGAAGLVGLVLRRKCRGATGSLT